MKIISLMNILLDYSPHEKPRERELHPCQREKSGGNPAYFDIEDKYHFKKGEIITTNWYGSDKVKENFPYRVIKNTFSDIEERGWFVIISEYNGNDKIKVRTEYFEKITIKKAKELLSYHKKRIEEKISDLQNDLKKI